MVLVKLPILNKQDKKWDEVQIYLDGYLKSNLDLGVQQLKKDFDQVWFIDGAEGSGKSDLAATCAAYVNPDKTRHTLINRIVTDIEKAEEVLLKAGKFDAVVLDESYGGMSSTGAMTKINRILQRRFTEIRAKNLFVFILAPSFMDINRYFAIWRSKALLHVYTKSADRGYAAFFNDEKKKRLYILGKKQFYNYGVVPSNFTFRFTKQMNKVIDKEEYDRKKADSSLTTRDADVDITNPELVRECWLKVQRNIPKIDCPPLTGEQTAALSELSRRSITRYNKLIREKQESMSKSAD